MSYWGSTAPAAEKESEDEAGAQESEEAGLAEEDMNFAERLTAVVGVLFVEKYEYTVDGLYYGGDMVRNWWNKSLSCGY